MVNAVTGGNFNQYCRPPGDLKLTRSLAKVYTPLFGLGRDIDPETEVTVTVGATEALYSCMMAFVEEGDEVIMLEPAFDIYAPQVQMAGGESVCDPNRNPNPNFNPKPNPNANPNPPTGICNPKTAPERHRW